MDTDTILKSFLCSVRRAGVLDESDGLRTSDGCFGSKIYQAIIDILVYISDHRRALHSLFVMCGVTLSSFVHGNTMNGIRASTVDKLREKVADMTAANECVESKLQSINKQQDAAFDKIEGYLGRNKTLSEDITKLKRGRAELEKEVDALNGQCELHERQQHRATVVLNDSSTHPTSISSTYGLRTIAIYIYRVDHRPSTWTVAQSGQCTLVLGTSTMTLIRVPHQ